MVGIDAADGAEELIASGLPLMAVILSDGTGVPPESDYLVAAGRI
jgi:hypothetical protein